jgi:hypothetical protein
MTSHRYFLKQYFDYYMKENRISEMDDFIAKPRWVDYIGGTLFERKEASHRDKQVGITYYPNLPYLEISLYTLS